VCVRRLLLVVVTTVALALLRTHRVAQGRPSGGVYLGLALGLVGARHGAGRAGGAPCASKGSDGADGAATPDRTSDRTPDVASEGERSQELHRRADRTIEKKNKNILRAFRH